MSSKKTKKKAPVAPREFGHVVRRLRVDSKEAADAMIAAGARCFREDERGFHLEMDEAAAKACEALNV